MSQNLTAQQLGILNALVTFAAEHISGGLSADEREVAKIVGNWALNPPTWPKYRMVINGKTKWLSVKQAGIAFDSGWHPVSIGGQVMEEDSTIRDITAAERTRISDIAEEWSASK